MFRQKPKWLVPEHQKEVVSHVEAILFEGFDEKFSYSDLAEWIGENNYTMVQREVPRPGCRWGTMEWRFKIKTALGTEADLHNGEYLVKLDSGKFLIMSADLYKALFESSGTEIKNDYTISWATGPTEETTDTDNRVELTRTDTSGAINWLSDKSETTEKDYYSHIAEF